MQSKIEDILDTWNKTYKKIDMSLDRLRNFLVKINSPQQSLPKTIHVAGTNGKGSTIAFLKAILETAGYSCHSYTSPHLLRFNERIVLDGKEISDSYLEEILTHVHEASIGDNLTYFEKTTAAAFLAFSQTPADYLLLETGLGGRLDATNVVPKKELTILTTISRDHMEYLGDDISGIAFEKASIMLPNTPCVSAPQIEEVERTFNSHAGSIGNKVEFAEILQKLPQLPLKGEHQKVNASVAVKAAKMLGIKTEAALKGLQFAKWPARMQLLKQGRYFDMLPESVELYVDGGHNVGAAKAICESFKPDFIIVGMMKTKEAKEFISEFSGIVKGACAVSIPKEENSFSPDELAKIAHDAGINAFYAETIENALTNIVIKYSGNLKILICGSLYLAAHVLKTNIMEPVNV